MDIKHQNQGKKLGQNRQIKFRSFQLMEGNPSISWQYFHRLEAFQLLVTYGYNSYEERIEWENVFFYLQFVEQR